MVKKSEVLPNNMQAAYFTASKEATELRARLVDLQAKVNYYENNGNVKGFVVHYDSEGNLFKGKKLILAPTIREAQDSFFSWLRSQEVYSHLWRLTINIDEVTV